MPSGTWAGVGRLGSTRRAVRSSTWRPSMALPLESDRQKAEDRHVKAELRDRRVAEQLVEPAQAQDRAKREDDDECRHRVADERRDEDVADDQLGKRVHHDTTSWARASRIAAARSKYESASATTALSRGLVAGWPGI